MNEVAVSVWNAEYHLDVKDRTSAASGYLGCLIGRPEGDLTTGRYAAPGCGLLCLFIVGGVLA